MTAGNQGSDVRCAQRIDAAVLTDYWMAVLPDSDEAVVEEHLLECNRCGARLREVIVLIEGVRTLAREGSLRMVVSDAYLRCASGAGLRVREYAPSPGGSVQCTVTADDDLLIARLAADVRGAARVDLCFCDADGVEQGRLTDIPVHPMGSTVVYQEAITIMKAAPTSTMIARLVSFDETGAERLLGEYTFNHTRSLPGPGAW